MKRVTVHVDPFAVARRNVRDDYVAAMREGRRQRAQTFASAKAYKRRTKHKEF